MTDGPPPMRISPPAAASRARARAWAGLASRKWNVVPPFIWTEGRGWWVRTKTGVWNGGFSPHQPFHSWSGQGPWWGPNLPRPMISAPIPGSPLLAKASSMPALPPGWPCMAWNVRVAKNHSCSRNPACPYGASRLCPPPVPNPSSETEKLCTRTRGTVTS